jgi:hypothetical protein
MKKKTAKSNAKVSFPDPTGKEPVDPDVMLPEQVRRAAALSETLVTGKPLERMPQRNRTFPHSDVEIDEAMQYIDSGDLEAADPRVATIIALAREGAQHIKSRRRGAREPREKSENVTRRLEALLQVYRELSPHLQKKPTGTATIHFLRRRLVQKLGLQDSDDVISEDTIRQDIRQVRPLLRLIQRGIIPRTGRPSRQGPSGRTRQEMEAGRKAAAKAASASKAQVRSNRHAKPKHNRSEK